MAFGYAGAASGAHKELQEVLQAAFAMQQAKAREELAKQELLGRADERGLRQLDMEADRQFREQQTERQGRIDAQALSERNNQAGARRMIGDFLTSRGGQPLDEAARQQLAGMSVSEGVEVPRSILEAPEDPNLGHTQALAEIEARKLADLEGVRARGVEERRTDAERLRLAGPQGSPGRADAISNVTSEYSAERRTRLRDAIADIEPQVGGTTVGLASYLGNVRGTPQRDFAAAVDYLKSNIAFNELTEMRAASKTGGALGQVSDRELNLLQAALGSLDVGQSPESFRKQLQNIKDSLDRWEAAKQQGGMAPMRSSPTTATPAAPTGRRFTILSVQ